MKISRLLDAVFVCLLAAQFSLANATAVFYTNETTFNAATSGMTLSLEGFETPFATASTVNFDGLSATVNNASDLESLASEQGGAPPSTEGLRYARYYTLAHGGGGITFTFTAPINVFSIDLIDPLDGAGNGEYLSLSNSNGDMQTLLTGSQGNNNVYFAGIVDMTQAFSSVTIFSTKPADAIGLDRLQFHVVPIPPAVWLFGSGLLGLMGMARRKT